MRKRFFSDWRLVAVAMGLASMIAVEGRSQDISPNALLQRLERLEQENRDLEQKLQKLSSPVNADGGVDAKTVENP